eukprot:TRINITY_DN49101_c0_g1_i1.p1 TRINITY_DN49101_c0_g1~~TRINITY_DN49101_c0_g1_i1.p1  ORF type:complete len:213 (-),score=45.81 TRINITY_DN49101_c0_g1_i1:264-902(-)
MAAHQLFPMLPQLAAGPPTQCHNAITVEVHPLLPCATQHQPAPMPDSDRGNHKSLVARRERDKEGRRRLREEEPEQYDAKLAARRERERMTRLRERETGAMARAKRLERRRVREKEKRLAETAEQRSERLLKRRMREDKRNQHKGSESSVDLNSEGSSLNMLPTNNLVSQDREAETMTAALLKDSLLQFVQSVTQSVHRDDAKPSFLTVNVD